MRFVLEQLSQPAIEPVTLAEQKLNLRAFSGVTATDANITAKIVAARAWAERYTGRVLVDQTWRQTVVMDTLDRPTGLPEWQSMRPGIPLFKSPVLAMTSFVTVDSTGAETAITAGTYEVQEAGSRWPRLVALTGSTWGTGSFRVEFRAGFADQTGSPQTGAEVVPECFKQAIMLYVEALYDKDEKKMGLLVKAAENLLYDECANLSLA